MNTLTHIEQHSPLTKASALSYGIIAYVIGVAGLGAIIFGMANILPLGSMVSLISHPALAFGFNVALTCLFGVQHLPQDLIK